MMPPRMALLMAMALASLEPSSPSTFSWRGLILIIEEWSEYEYYTSCSPDGWQCWPPWRDTAGGVVGGSGAAAGLGAGRLQGRGSVQRGGRGAVGGGRGAERGPAGNTGHRGAKQRG